MLVGEQVMIMDIQIIIETVSKMMLIAFPISLVLSIMAKITNFFVSLVFGREVRL